MKGIQSMIDCSHKQSEEVRRQLSIELISLAGIS